MGLVIIPENECYPSYSCDNFLLSISFSRDFESDLSQKQRGFAICIRTTSHPVAVSSKFSFDLVPGTSVKIACDVGGRRSRRFGPTFGFSPGGSFQLE